MERKIMNDVYRDFFDSNLIGEESAFKIEDVEVEENIINIDDLYITDESKELLKKIILYMEKYNNKEESNYITFNITLESTDKTTINNIGNLLKYYSNKYNYCTSNKLKEISFYEIEKVDSINSLYTSNSVISFSDLDALNMNDVPFIKKFIYNLKENLDDKKITLISGKGDTLKTFLFNDDSLSNTYFNFKLIGSKPSVNDVYNEIINTNKISDEFNIKVLDYITNTYEKSNLDYDTYVSNLNRYISFNKTVPELEKSKSIDEVFKELNELVGLQKVKDSLHDLVDLITLKNKTKDDLKINNVNLHMVFLGNPGTGKTTVARLISDILYDLKYIKQNKLIEVSSKDLVAEYVGQTAVKTMNVVEKAMGGILFVDEAYALADKGNDNSFNGEAIATLIKAMEDHRDNLVVIFAGYTKEMQDFLDSNSGIVSRIGYTLEFDDYTNDELKAIFSGMVKKAGFVLEENALVEVDNLINEHRFDKNFGNARFVRNIYEKTVINHASNTRDVKNKKILKTITKDDITL